MSGIDWPTASLDPIRRLKVLAAAVPGSAWAEATLDAPFDQVWPWLTDFERSVARFDAQVQRVQVRRRWIEDGAERVDLVATTFGIPVPLRARVERGFCLMAARARAYLVVMAAVPDEGRTRFCHLEAVPIPGAKVSHGAIQRAVTSDVENISRLAAAGFPPP